MLGFFSCFLVPGPRRRRAHASARRRRDADRGSVAARRPEASQGRLLPEKLPGLSGSFLRGQHKSTNRSNQIHISQQSALISTHHTINNEQRNVAEAHLDTGSLRRIVGMAGSQCHRCGAGRHRRDLAAILGPGSLGGGERVARSYRASPRRDRNDGDVAAAGVGSVRVGRGERVERSYGRGAVTSLGAARLVERAIRLRTPIIPSRAPSAISPRT